MTDTEMCNMALSHLGVSTVIADLANDTGTEAVALRTFFSTAFQVTLEKMDWSFARRYVTLGLVETDPNEDFGYAYRYPADCLVIRRIQSGLRNDNRRSRVTYNIGSDVTGRLIYTDVTPAIVRYTKNITDYSLIPASFGLAQSYYLAFLIAPKLTKGDPFQRQQAVMGLFKSAMDQAAANMANEEQPDPEPESELTLARGGDDYGRFGRG